MVMGILLALLVLPLGGHAVAADDRTEWCGQLSTYTSPTATRAGSMQIGDRVFVILPAPAPAAEKFPAQTLVGSLVCLGARSDAQGRLLVDSTYGVGLTPMPPVLCGLVVSYSPPARTSSGQIRLSGGVGNGALLVLDTSYPWPASLADGHTCVTTGSDARGLALARGLGASNTQPGGMAPTTLPNTAGGPSLADGLQAAAAAAVALVATALLWIRVKGGTLGRRRR